MSHDIVADTLNELMNATKAGKTKVTVNRHSKLLMSVLAIAKLKGYVKSYKIEGIKLTIEIDNIHGCKAIKPRFLIHSEDIEKYVKRYLPAKDIGIIIISTPSGLMTHQTAQEKKIGGSLIAYMY